MINSALQIAKDSGEFKGDTGEVSEEQLSNTVVEERLTSNTLYSTAIKGFAVGREVNLTDISPLTHELQIKVESKNLIQQPYQEKDVTTGDVTHITNSDGSITFNGTVLDNNQSMFLGTGKDYKPALISGRNYCLSLDSNIGALIMKVFDNENSKIIYFSQKTSPFIWSDDYTFQSIYILLSSNQVIDNETVYPQLEQGTTVTDYSPYVKDLEGRKISRSSGVNVDSDHFVYAVSADGTVEGVTSLYPTTVLTGNGTIAINCEYNIDTKTYIDNQIAELKTAILSMGTNV